MTIGKQITSGFGVAVAITIGLGLFSYSRLSAIDRTVAKVMDDSVPSCQAIKQLDTDTQEQRGFIMLRASATDPQQTAQLDKSLDESQATVDKDIAAYEPLQDPGEDTDNFTALKGLIAKWSAVKDQMLALAHAGKGKEAASLYMTAGWPAFEEFGSQLDKMADWNQKQADETTAVAKSAISAGQRGVEVGLVTSVSCVAILATIIILSTKRSLMTVANSLSTGAEQVASASSQVSSASQSLAQGASESAASLEETSSSLEEISSMTKKNADTAHQARRRWSK
jgi:methyl-accepting chemotaxis protein